MISTYSRVRASGFENGRPYQPSTTCGPLTPMPTHARPSDRPSRVIACIAIAVGVRALIWAIPVQSFTFEVAAATAASGENASELQDSPVQIESKPRLSTNVARSTSSRAGCGCAVQYPNCNPNFRFAVTD